jgi:ISXO2-like transposase domain
MRDAQSGPICAPFLRANGKSVRIGGEGPCVLLKVSKTKGLSRATRPLMTTRGPLTPVEMTLCKWFEYIEKFKLYHYRKIRKHDSVNHIKEEWVRGNVHTNSIENYWSLFKRGLIGSFHQVSVKHLERYMAEFDYRFNNRKDVDIFIKTIARMCGTIPMPMAQLTADPDVNQPF